MVEDLHTSFRLEYINSETTTYDFLTNKKLVNNLESIKKGFKDVEIFTKNKNDYTDSVTSIIKK